MKAQDVNHLHALLDKARDLKLDYDLSAAEAYSAKRSRQGQPGTEQLLEIAAARSGALMDAYGALYQFMASNQDEIFKALRTGKGKR